MKQPRKAFLNEIDADWETAIKPAYTEQYVNIALGYGVSGRNTRKTVVDEERHPSSTRMALGCYRQTTKHEKRPLRYCILHPTLPPSSSESVVPSEEVTIFVLLLAPSSLRNIERSETDPNGIRVPESTGTTKSEKLSVLSWNRILMHSGPGSAGLGPAGKFAN
jgi:hypothetical protein